MDLRPIAGITLLITRWGWNGKRTNQRDSSNERTWFGRGDLPIQMSLVFRDCSNPCQTKPLFLLLAGFVHQSHKKICFVKLAMDCGEFWIKEHSIHIIEDDAGRAADASAR